MSKKISKKQTKLNNLLIILILAALLLIMSTYAWFTANRTVRIDAINVNVTTVNGLQISANGFDWKTILSNEDIAGAHQANRANGIGGYPTVINQLPSVIAPVSTAFTQASASGAGANQLAMFYGTVETDLATGKYYLTAAKQTDTSTNGFESTQGDNYYMAFDIFLKLSGEDSDLYFTADAEEDVHDNVIKNIDRAARIAIIKGSHSDEVEDSQVTTAYHTLATVPGSNNVYCIEPKANVHNQHALDYATNIGWTTYSATSTQNYDGIIAEIGSANKVELGKATASDTPAYFANAATTKVNTDGLANVQIQPDAGASKGIEAGVTKYRVYLYIEGQDIDCENYASGGYLDYTLQFSLDPFTP